MSAAVSADIKGRRFLGARGRYRIVTRIAIAVLGLAILIAILAPLVAPADPNKVDILNPHGPWGSENLLGTDASGRDILSRLTFGLRTALFGPIVVVGLSTVVGVILVLTAAWFGGWVDILVARLLDVLLAFPGLLIAVVVVALAGASLTTAALALSISYIPYIARVLRSQALSERRRAYIEAAWLQGNSGTQISLQQLMPNLFPLLIAQVVLALSYAIIDLAALSFLGLAVQPPTADLGSMVASGQRGLLDGHPSEVVSASLVIIALVLALNVLGDRLGEWAENR